METKRDIRERLLRQRETLSEEERRVLDRRLREKLSAHPRYKGCRRLFSYVSFRGEADTREIVRQALAEGKETAVPRVCGRRMEFRRIRSLEELRPGAYGILEPEDGEILTPEEGDVILVPGAAFDRSGRRIGYGGGYYDRYFDAHPEGYAIGLAYAFQVLDALPEEAHDRAVNEVLDSGGKDEEWRLCI